MTRSAEATLASIPPEAAGTTPRRSANDPRAIRLRLRAQLSP